MKKNSLVPNKGLSISQAQSISNLCNQSAQEIDSTLRRVNNFSKSIEIDRMERTLINAQPLPEDTIDLLKRKAILHACQAFLMENIKAKQDMLEEAKYELPNLSNVEKPAPPKFIKIAEQLIDNVDEDWGWEQLTVSEINEYLEAEAFAAHIGQFIHKKGILSNLRDELPNIPSIEWMEIETGKKSPINIEIHHDSKKLLELHVILADEHRKYEQRVNYFKAKVKNLVTAENAKIAKLNSDFQTEASKVNNDLQVEYQTATKKMNEQIQTISLQFEEARSKKISEIASMRINVDPRFQEIINEFLKE